MALISVRDSGSEDAIFKLTVINFLYFKFHLGSSL